MDMIQGYCSSDTSINEEQNSVGNEQNSIEYEQNLVENDTVEAGVDELSPRQVRYVYLITHSQADKNKFPRRHHKERF